MGLFLLQWPVGVLTSDKCDMNLRNFPQKLDSKTSNLRIRVPDNLDLALEGLIRKVLREQPKIENIYTFAAHYFETLIKIRDAAGSKYTGSQICPFHNDEDASDMIKLANTFLRISQDGLSEENKVRQNSESAKENKNGEQRKPGKENKNPFGKKITPKPVDTSGKKPKSPLNKQTEHQSKTNSTSKQKKDLEEKVKNGKTLSEVKKENSMKGSNDEYLFSDSIKELEEKEILKEKLTYKNEKEKEKKTGEKKPNEDENEKDNPKSREEEENLDELCTVVDKFVIACNENKNTECEAEDKRIENEKQQDNAQKIKQENKESKTAENNEESEVTKKAREDSKALNFASEDKGSGKATETTEETRETVKLEDSTLAEPVIAETDQLKLNSSKGGEEKLESRKKNDSLEEANECIEKENVKSGKKTEKIALVGENFQNEKTFETDSKSEKNIQDFRENEEIQSTDDKAKEETNNTQKNIEKDKQIEVIASEKGEENEDKKIHEKLLQLKDKSREQVLIEGDKVEKVKPESEDTEAEEKDLERINLEKPMNISTEVAKQDDQALENNKVESETEKEKVKQILEESKAEENVNLEKEVTEIESQVERKKLKDSKTESKDGSLSEKEEKEAKKNENIEDTTEITLENQKNEETQDEEIASDEKGNSKILGARSDGLAEENLSKDKTEIRDGEDVSAEETTIEKESKLQSAPELQKQSLKNDKHEIFENVKSDLLNVEGSNTTLEDVVENLSKISKSEEQEKKLVDESKLELQAEGDLNIEREVKVESVDETKNEEVELKKENKVKVETKTGKEEKVKIKEENEEEAIKRDIEKKSNEVMEESKETIKKSTKEGKKENEEKLETVEESEEPGDAAGNKSFGEKILNKGKQIKTITTHYYDLLEVPKSLAREYKVHHVDTPKNSNPLPVVEEMTAEESKALEVDVLTQTEEEEEKDQTKQQEEEKIHSAEHELKLLKPPVSLLKVSVWAINEQFLENEKKFSSLDKRCITSESLHQDSGNQKEELDVRKEVEEVIEKTLIPSTLEAVPLKPRKPEEIDTEISEAAKSLKEPEPEPESLSSDDRENSSNFQATASDSSKSIDDADVPVITVEVKTLIETQACDEEKEEAQVEIEVAVSTMDAAEDADSSKSNEDEKTEDHEEGKEYAGKEENQPESTQQGRRTIDETSLEESESTVSSAATEIKRTDLVKRSSSQTLLEAQSLVDSEKKKPLTKAKSMFSMRQEIPDHEVWKTIQNELENAATKIQSKFRGYSTRKKLRRENAVQITTEEPSNSATPVQEQGQRATGEMHDTIVLSIYPR